MIVLRKNPQDRDAAGSTRRDPNRLDRSIFASIATTATPSLGQLLRRTSNSADRARLWLGIAARLAVVGGRSGRRTAAEAVAALALTSASVNLVATRVVARERPDRDAIAVLARRRVRVPASAAVRVSRRTTGRDDPGAAGCR